MCDESIDISKNKFVQHNVFFLSWLLATKKNVNICKIKNKEVYLITGIDKELYKEYKKEYKLHRALLKNIKNKMKVISEMV